MAGRPYARNDPWIENLRSFYDNNRHDGQDNAYHQPYPYQDGQRYNPRETHENGYHHNDYDSPPGYGAGSYNRNVRRDDAERPQSHLSRADGRFTRHPPGRPPYSDNHPRGRSQNRQDFSPRRSPLVEGNRHEAEHWRPVRDSRDNRDQRSPNIAPGVQSVDRTYGVEIEALRRGDGKDSPKRDGSESNRRKAPTRDASTSRQSLPTRYTLKIEKGNREIEVSFDASYGELPQLFKGDLQQFLKSEDIVGERQCAFSLDPNGSVQDQNFTTSFKGKISVKDCVPYIVDKVHETFASCWMGRSAGHKALKHVDPELYGAYLGLGNTGEDTRGNQSPHEQLKMIPKAGTGQRIDRTTHVNAMHKENLILTKGYVMMGRLDPSSRIRLQSLAAFLAASPPNPAADVRSIPPGLGLNVNALMRVQASTSPHTPEDLTELARKGTTGLVRTLSCLPFRPRLHCPTPERFNSPPSSSPSPLHPEAPTVEHTPAATPRTTQTPSQLDRTSMEQPTQTTTSQPSPINISGVTGDFTIYSNSKHQDAHNTNLLRESREAHSRDIAEAEEKEAEARRSDRPLRYEE